MTGMPSSQCTPIWHKESKQLIGIKLPVFIDPKNMYTYSFVLSLKTVVNTLVSTILPEISSPFNDSFEKYSKAIVRINVGGQFGTGVIIHPDGYILTNKHVIDGKGLLKINETEEVEIIAKSRGLYDLALLKLTQPKTYPYLEIFKGELKVDLVDDYYSTGYGMWSVIRKPAFCKGYIRKLIKYPAKAGKRRTQFISHSCDTYDGNSGGPIINSKGEIVGINFENICFKYFDSLKQKVKVLYSKLGFAISHEVFDDLVDVLFDDSMSTEATHKYIRDCYCLTYNGRAYL